MVAARSPSVSLDDVLRNRPNVVRPVGRLLKTHSALPGERNQQPPTASRWWAKDTGSRNTTGSEKEIGMTTEKVNPRHVARPVQRLYTNTRHNGRQGAECREFSPGFSSRGRYFSWHSLL